MFCESNYNAGTDTLDAGGFEDDIFLRYIEYIRREMGEE